MIKTKVGKHDVSVRDAHQPSIVWFDAGVHGKSFGERGWFAFWTTVIGSGKKKIWGRSLLCIPIGDRFTRMQKEQYTAKTKEDRKIYSDYWNVRLNRGKAVKYIRPSTTKEIEKWIQTHQSDAKFIKHIFVSGKYALIKNIPHVVGSK